MHTYGANLAFLFVAEFLLASLLEKSMYSIIMCHEYVTAGALLHNALHLPNEVLASSSCSQ